MLFRSATAEPASNARQTTAANVRVDDIPGNDMQVTPFPDPSSGVWFPGDTEIEQGLCPDRYTNKIRSKACGREGRLTPLKDYTKVR